MINRYKLFSAITVLSLLFALTTISTAQSVKTGAKAGINFASFYGDGVDTESLTGYMLGGFIKMNLPKSPVSIQPELFYSRKGAKSGDSEIKLDYIEIPILVKVGLSGGSGSVSPNLFAGPYAGINLKQSSGGGLLGGGGNNAEDIDFGGVVGAGLDIEAGSAIFTIDARYGFGLTPVYESGDAKNSVFAISAGISLPGK